jgi:CoA-transferase family III
VRPGLVYVSLCAFSHKGPWASRRGFDTVVQNVSTTRQGELFRGTEPGPQFYPVSVIDYLTGYLMAFGAMLALARRARQGGSCLVRISLAQTGRWVIDRGEVPEAALEDMPKETPQADIDRWSFDSDTPVDACAIWGPLCSSRRPRLTGPAFRSRSAITSQAGRPAPRDLPSLALAAPAGGPA